METVVFSDDEAFGADESKSPPFSDLALSFFGFSPYVIPKLFLLFFHYSSSDLITTDVNNTY